jgi:hypothetical protein
MELLAFHWTDFHEIWYWVILRISVKEIHCSLTSDNSGYCTWGKYTFMIILCSHLRMKSVSDESFRQNQNTLHVDFFFENLFVYEIMWKNMVEPGRPRVAIWRMLIACWIPKATNKLRICNTYCFSTTPGFTKAPYCYVTRTMPVLLVMLKYCAPCALQVWRTSEFKYKDRRSYCENWNELHTAVSECLPL